MLSIHVIGEGNSFGELSMLNNTKRQAAIITSSDCVFGVLNRKEYKTIIQ